MTYKKIKRRLGARLTNRTALRISSTSMHLLQTIQGGHSLRLDSHDGDAEPTPGEGIFLFGILQKDLKRCAEWS